MERYEEPVIFTGERGTECVLALRESQTEIYLASDPKGAQCSNCYIGLLFHF